VAFTFDLKGTMNASVGLARQRGLYGKVVPHKECVAESSACQGRMQGKFEEDE